MSLFLGFVKNKMSLAYDTYKADKTPTRRGEEDRRAEASASRRGWARPAQYLRAPAFPRFPWVGLRRAKLCESKRRALLCAIPSRFSASQTLLLRRVGSAKTSAVCFPLRLVESESRPVHCRAMRKGRAEIRLGAKYLRAAQTRGAFRCLLPRTPDEEPHTNAKYAYLCATRSFTQVRSDTARRARWEIAAHGPARKR